MDKWRNKLDEPEFEKNLRRSAPTFANINLLGDCNVDCYFCLGKDIDAEFKKHKHTNKPFSLWPRFNDFLVRCRDADIRRLYVTGQNTDALIYRHLGELIRYLQMGNVFEVGLRTNGYLAHRRMEEINTCRRNVGYSIHSLDPATNWQIMRRRDLPNWDDVIPATRRCRVSIVLGRYNEAEFDDLLRYVCGFHNITYVQVRRICTDTRETYLIEDVQAYERVFERVSQTYERVEDFYAAEQFLIHGKTVCFWRTVKTTIDSFNYYTDGTINDEYFVIEGYMRESRSYPRVEGIPVKVAGLEGYWHGK